MIGVIKKSVFTRTNVKALENQLTAPVVRCPQPRLPDPCTAWVENTTQAPAGHKSSHPHTYLRNIKQAPNACTDVDRQKATIVRAQKKGTRRNAELCVKCQLNKAVASYGAASFPKCFLSTRRLSNSVADDVSWSEAVGIGQPGGHLNKVMLQLASFAWKTHSSVVATSLTSSQIAG